MDESLVISHYITNPLLINKMKFDLRIYVAVTGFDPLRIYIYNEGLARFCTENFNLENLEDKFAHLTNYAINKKSKKFVSPDNISNESKGSKWTITAINKYLESQEIDINLLWSRIYDVVIKSIISIEPIIYSEIKKYEFNGENFFELFGYDILIDNDLKPWIMEVNLSPSLSIESNLDFVVKSNLVKDLLNLTGIYLFDRKKESQRVKSNNLRTKPNREKMENHIEEENYQSKKIGDLKPITKKMIIDSIEEYERKGNFIRIYPMKGSKIYDCYFELQRTSNKILYYFLYEYQFINEKDISFKNSLSKVIHIDNSNPQKNDMIRKELSKSRESKRSQSKCASTVADKTEITQYPDSKPKKVIITGDDILIEYISRLVSALKSLNESEIKSSWNYSIEKFILHNVWTCSDNRRSDKIFLWQRLESRLIEMKERRKRLMRSIAMANIQNFEKEYLHDQEKKQIVIQAFSVKQLEEMLINSTKNIAHEVVSCLISARGIGVLTYIVRYLSENGNSRIMSNSSVLENSLPGISAEKFPRDSEPEYSQLDNKIIRSKKRI